MLAWAVADTVRADQTVTLAKRQFASGSPAAPFERFVTEARRLAASTTPAWGSTDSDLSAWGPAVIFPLLDRSVSTQTVVGLSAPLESEGIAPVIMFRTMGLYAAKGRAPFAETASLMNAIRRNLRTLEHATNDLEAFTAAPGLAEWGSIGGGAWLAYLELLWRDYGELGNPGAERWPRDGVRIVDELMVRGRRADGSGFRRDPREDELTLWPNALMIYALVKAYENEEVVKYETAAIAAAAGVEALRAADGSYFSAPAKTQKDARANAYLAGALLMLFKDTGDVQYRERAAGILRWLTSGESAGASAKDAGHSAHVAYLALLLDSLATQPYENLLGRRPMRSEVQLGAVPSPQTIDEMAKRLRPADFRYRELFDRVLHTLIERVPRVAGDFGYDYGDAPGYAVEVLRAASDTVVAPEIIQREVRLLKWPRPRDFDEISFGVNALFDADRENPADESAARALRHYVLLSGGMAVADRYYMDWLDWLTGGGGFDYGPTVIGAQLAAAQLRYAEHFPNQKVGWLIQPLQVGRALLDGADRVAWDAARHIYRARTGSGEIWLLPNAMMTLDLVQAHHATGDASYVARAEEVARGMEALWDDKRGAYFASDTRMGENAYESLSTNAYAALAQLRLYEATQNSAYRDRALRVFDFIAHDLYADGIVYHHLYRGRRASGDIWCTGCNWRLLSALMELASLTQ